MELNINDIVDVAKTVLSYAGDHAYCTYPMLPWSPWIEVGLFFELQMRGEEAFLTELITLINNPLYLCRIDT